MFNVWIIWEQRDIFFPKLSEKLHLITFSKIAKKYLKQRNYECYECESEDEARNRVKELIDQNKWPCYFFKSDTTGEKDFEEFFTDKEDLDLETFKNIGIIRNEAKFDSNKLDQFIDGIESLKALGKWSKHEILELYNILLPDFDHKETGKYLDQRM